MRNYRARGISADNKPIFDEFYEHCVVARWLEARNVFFIHVPNGGSRNKAEAKKLKAMGVKPGVSDFLIFDSPPKFKDFKGAVLEIKALDGKTPPEGQQRFLTDMNMRGYRVVWCKGADEAINWLEGLGY